ncbi:hypothetical protein SK128_011713, partial [Halocaridina rubra]
NPVLPTWVDSQEELLPSTTSPAPADTLHSPLIDTYLSVTPSINPGFTRAQGRAIITPHHPRIHQRSNQILPRRISNSRGPWRVGQTRGLQRWPLQALDEKNRPPNIQSDDRTLQWWVTNEPQLTLIAPDTNLNQKVTHPNQLSNRGGSPRKPSFDVITSRVPYGGRYPSSRPTTSQPPRSPTTLAEDPAQLEANFFERIG